MTSRELVEELFGRTGQAFVAHPRRRDEQRERAHPLAVIEREQLPDHAAHRAPDDMGPVDGQRVHQDHHIARHVVECVELVGFDLRREPTITIVETDDAEARADQRGNEIEVPS